MIFNLIPLWFNHYFRCFLLKAVGSSSHDLKFELFKCSSDDINFKGKLNVVCKETRREVDIAMKRPHRVIIDDFFHPKSVFMNPEGIINFFIKVGINAHV